MTYDRGQACHVFKIRGTVLLTHFHFTIYSLNNSITNTRAYDKKQALVIFTLFDFLHQLY